MSWVGIGLSVLFLGLAFKNVQFKELGAVLSEAHWRWVPLAVGMYFIGHIFRGIRSCYILAPHTKLSWPRAMNLVLIGYAANNVLPARLGELIRTYVLGRLQSMSMTTALATIFVERVFDGMAVVGILIVVAGGWQDRPPLATTALWLGSAVFLGAFLCTFGVALFQERFLALARWGLRPFPESLREKLLAILQKLLKGMDFMHSTQTLLFILGLSACIWIAEGAMFWCALLIIGIEPMASAAYFATSVTNLAIVIPAAPGFVGTFHNFCKQSVMAFGVPEAKALAYAIVVHALHFIPVTLSGLWALHHYGFGLGAVAHEVENQS